MSYCRCHRGTVTQRAFHVSNNQINSLEVVKGTHTHTHTHTYTHTYKSESYLPCQCNYTLTYSNCVCVTLCFSLSTPSYLTLTGRVVDLTFETRNYNRVSVAYTNSIQAMSHDPVQYKVLYSDTSNIC